MKIIQDIRYVVVFQAQLSKHLLAQNFNAVWMCPMFYVASQFCQMLAVFLPLKVILLVGSEGVPYYFSPFIGAEHKTRWVFLLTVVSVIAYILSILTLRLGNRLNQSAAERFVVCIGSKSCPKNRRQTSHIAATFRSVAWMNCHLAIVLLVIAAQGFIDLWILSGVLVIVAVEVAIANLMLTSNQKWLFFVQGKVRKNMMEFVQFNGFFVFFGTFLIMLILFIYFDGLNILLAILVVLTLRRGIGSVVGLIKEWRKLKSSPKFYSVLLKNRVHGA